MWQLADANKVVAQKMKEWKECQKHRDILVRKESVPDYAQLVREYEKIEKSRISRPRTAFAPMSQVHN
ncbi:unnamed protein product [Sphagnum balticum]